MSLEKVCHSGMPFNTWPIFGIYSNIYITYYNSITYNWLMLVDEEVSKGYRIAIFLLENCFLRLFSAIASQTLNFFWDVRKGWYTPVN